MQLKITFGKAVKSVKEVQTQNNTLLTTKAQVKDSR